MEFQLWFLSSVHFNPWLSIQIRISRFDFFVLTLLDLKYTGAKDEEKCLQDSPSVNGDRPASQECSWFSWFARTLQQKLRISGVCFYNSTFRQSVHLAWRFGNGSKVGPRMKTPDKPSVLTPSAQSFPIYKTGPMLCPYILGKLYRIFSICNCYKHKALTYTALIRMHRQQMIN